MFDPLGIGSALLAAVEAIGTIFGRRPKQKKESRGQRILAGTLYLLFLVGGVVLIVFVVHRIYFEK